MFVNGISLISATALRRGSTVRTARPGTCLPKLSGRFVCTSGEKHVFLFYRTLYDFRGFVRRLIEPLHRGCFFLVFARPLRSCKSARLSAYMLAPSSAPVVLFA